MTSLTFSFCQKSLCGCFRKKIDLVWAKTSIDSFKCRNCSSNFLASEGEYSLKIPLSSDQELRGPLQNAKGFVTNQILKSGKMRCCFFSFWDKIMIHCNQAVFPKDNLIFPLFSIRLEQNLSHFAMDLSAPDRNRTGDLSNQAANLRRMTISCLNLVQIWGLCSKGCGGNLSISTSGSLELLPWVKKSCFIFALGHSERLGASRQDLQVILVVAYVALNQPKKHSRKNENH